jgi:hypothetical protein
MRRGVLACVWGVAALVVRHAAADDPVLPLPQLPAPEPAPPPEEPPRQKETIPPTTDAPEASSDAPKGSKGYLFEAAGRSGYASAPIRGAVNPFGAGIGARLGFNISGVYLGATVTDYLGGSDVGATDQALLFGVELGYSLRLGRYVTLRPQVGLGDAILSHSEPVVTPNGVDVVTSASGGGGGSSVTTQVKNIYLEPGVVGMVGLGSFIVALRGSILVLPGIVYGPAPAESTTWFSYALEAQIGFRL